MFGVWWLIFVVLVFVGCRFVFGVGCVLFWCVGLMVRHVGGLLVVFGVWGLVGGGWWLVIYV